MPIINVDESEEWRTQSRYNYVFSLVLILVTLPNISLVVLGSVPRLPDRRLYDFASQSFVLDDVHAFLILPLIRLLKKLLIRLWISGDIRSCYLSTKLLAINKVSLTNIFLLIDKSFIVIFRLYDTHILKLILVIPS